MATLTVDKPSLESKVKTMDAIEDGVYAAKRAIINSKHQLEDLRDTAKYRVRRAPLASVGMGFGVGIVFGAVLGLIAGKAVKR